MTSLNTEISTQNPKTMIYTTLNRIREHSPCSDGWRRLVRHLGTDFPMDEPFPLVEILNAEGDGLDDCLWALRAEPQHAKLYRLYAVNRARSIQHLMTDPRSIAAIDVAERYAHGTATSDELAAAWTAAWAAARDVARAAEWAAAQDAAFDAARGAAFAAAFDAVRDAARGASGCATLAAAVDAGGCGAFAEAWAAAQDAAESGLREVLTNHHAMPGEPVL